MVIREEVGERQRRVEGLSKMCRLSELLVLD